MKTILYIGVLILAASLVLGQELPSETVNAAGLLPSNPLWGLDVAFDRLAITFSADKAKARVAFLDERWSEMVVESNDKPVIEVAGIVFAKLPVTNAYEEYAKEAIVLESDSFSDEAILAYEKHLSVLKELQSKLPAQAQQGISRAISNGEKLIVKKMSPKVCGDNIGGTVCEAQVRTELNKLKQNAVEKKTSGGMSYGK